MLEKIVIPVLTFFKNSKIDIDANLEYIKFLNSLKIKNIILLGTTSEGVLISLSDKQQLIDLYVKNLRNGINIILAPSLWAIEDFKSLINRHARIKDILFLPNSYFNRKVKNLEFYLKKIFKDSQKNIILYNLPKNTLVDFTPSIVESLKESGLNIIGIKLSHTNYEVINIYKRIDNLTVMYGSDKNILEALNNNADYVVCQNLSACIDQSICENNIQDLVNDVRTFISNKSDKILSLKQYLTLQNSILKEEVI